MIIRSVLIFLFLFAFYTYLSGQDNYLLVFTDKKGVSFDPYSYFDKKAIDRRIKSGISLYDETDFPLNDSYRRKAATMVSSVDIELRWFNALSVYATEDQIEHVKKLPFIKEVILLNREFELAEQKTENEANGIGDYELNLLFKQTDRMNAVEFSNSSIDGRGVRIAIFDGGFPTYRSHSAFEHIRRENRIIDTWDFTKKNKNVDRGNSHGTATFSCVGGMYEDQQIGLATGAEFLLAITEVNSEPYKEEKWWLAAAEWADRNGADIISSSLGYVNQRYFPEEMDGHHSLVSKAARLAVRKGILVVNSAGNEATNKLWKTIITPADVDSVLTVGGIDPVSNFHTSFSSLGPAADGTMKPNVSAYGHVIAASKNSSFSETQGTSFSCPLIAGFAACAWQTNRDMTNMELFREIEKSADLYPYFDYAHGFGIPQASYFMLREKQDVMPTFQILEDGDFIKVIVNDSFYYEEFDTTMTDTSEYYNEYDENGDFKIDPIENDTLNNNIQHDEEIELNEKEEELYIPENDSIRNYEIYPSDEMPIEELYGIDQNPFTIKLNETNYIDYLYYNIQAENGVLKNYHVIQVYDKEVLKILKGKPGTVLNVHYKGFTNSFRF